jgi:hypothetical protein
MRSTMVTNLLHLVCVFYQLSIGNMYPSGGVEDADGIGNDLDQDDDNVDYSAQLDAIDV